MTPDKQIDEFASGLRTGLQLAIDTAKKFHGPRVPSIRDRPGGAHGNGYVPLTGMHIADAIQALKEMDLSVQVQQRRILKNKLATDGVVADAVRRLAEVLLECAGDLEAELRARYGENIHPVEQARYDRDLNVVLEARALVADLLSKDTN